MSALSELSILIVTWNGDELLKNCLDSVRRACGTEPEIVVVDNANLESTKALVATHPNAQYIAAPENLGFAGGNNLGLPLCTRPYILLLNNDTIVHEEPFTQLIQYLKDHPKVAVVQGKMKLPLQGDILDACGFILNGAGIAMNRCAYLPASTPLESGVKVYGAKGAMLLLRASVLNSLSGILFHNSFLNNFEEADFCYRVWMAGYEVHFVDTVAISHLCSQSITKLNSDALFVRTLSNAIISFASTLQFWGILRVFPGLTLFHLLIFLRYLTTLNTRGIARYGHVISTVFKSRHEIATLRKINKRNRKTSDRLILKDVMARPGLRYYLDEMRGRYPSYKGGYLPQ